MVPSRGLSKRGRRAVGKKGLLIGKAEPWPWPNRASRLNFASPQERMPELTEFYRIAVWARNFRARRSVSIGKDLSSYDGASIGGAHHVRE